jgi:hypothetical protein
VRTTVLAEAQTNGNALATGRQQGTNWATSTGSTATDKKIITVVLTNNTVFFRMIYP